MTAKERRNAFIKNLITLEVKNAELRNKFVGGNIYRAGIVHNFSEIKAKNIVSVSLKNDISFESNFYITLLDENDLNINLNWNIRDALVFYSTHEDTRADFIPFSNIIEVNGEKISACAQIAFFTTPKKSMQEATFSS